MSDSSSDRDSGEITPTRRSMLMKIGLAAGAAYAAPVLMQLGQAHASGGGSGASGSGGRRRRRRGSGRRVGSASGPSRRRFPIRGGSRGSGGSR